MPKITVLPHATVCPEGKTFEVKPGVKLARALLANGVGIEHEVFHLFAFELLDRPQRLDALAPADEHLLIRGQQTGIEAVDRRIRNDNHTPRRQYIRKNLRCRADVDVAPAAEAEDRFHYSIFLTIEQK